jgi:aspartokinase/homoserine dehydrogenase 1
MKVMKFGGSSLENPQRIAAAADIIEASHARGKVGVVLSAMKGVTDALIQCSQDAEKGDTVYLRSLESLEDRHIRVLRQLIPKPGGGREADVVKSLFGELKAILHSVELIQECSPTSYDLILSFGERLSTLIISAYLRSRDLPAQLLDARGIIITKANTYPAVVLPESAGRIKKKMAAIPGIPVIPGFIASNEKGVTTTLGRDGSDYTASLVAAAVRAESVEIWTDVDGVMSADPRVVKNAFVIPTISYEEAMELSYFGAKVLHPNTMIPAVDAGIPIRIKNTLNPQAPGTLIAAKTDGSKTPITGMASITELALINVQGGGMIGVTGIAARIFGALASTKVNIIMISQASSEHSICLVFREEEVEPVRRALREELALEFQSGRIQNLDIQRDLVIIAVIGENMRGTPGISGMLFSSLGREGINVLAIAQGSSERNISFVITRKDMEKALRSIHKTFLEREDAV